LQSTSHRGLHVAIIMDGNGRWATRRGLPRTAGHRAGVSVVQRIVERAPDVGISTLTLYAFSSDNWRRPVDEVQTIFWLLRAYLRIETARMKQRGVRLSVIGRRDRLPLVQREIDRVESVTAGGTRVHLRIAVDYSSRDSIARAIAGVTPLLTTNGPMPTELLARHLADALTRQSEDVDLLIRTGGEKRLSDFLLWESAYAELLFTDQMWPDFSAHDLDLALAEFRRRERRFGGVPRGTNEGITAHSVPKLTVAEPVSTNGNNLG
jgi:undecaprenyl diphosphate synthase